MSALLSDVNVQTNLGSITGQCTEIDSNGKATKIVAGTQTFVRNASGFFERQS